MKFKTLFLSSLLAFMPVAAQACPEHAAAGHASGTKEHTAMKCCAEGKCSADKVKTASLSVPKIHCAGCKKGIETTLTKMKGVKSVSTDINTKVVTVQYDSATVSRYALTKELERIGYASTPVVETKANAKMTETASASAAPMACCKKN